MSHVSASWYADWFDRDAYALVYARRDEGEAERAVDLIVRATGAAPPAAVLDVACGRGRHALAFARRGFSVTGLDLSARALDAARHAARRAHLNVRFRRQDMREPYCDGCADLVVNLFTAFGYFEDDAESARALAAMATAVRPGGFFVQDFLNAPRVAATLVPETTRRVGETEVTERRWIEGGFVRKTITLRAQGHEETHGEAVRLFTPDDLAALHAAAGLRVVARYGDYDGGALTPESPRCVLVSRKSDA
jgi:SAM-dependent methyltransferase